MQEFFVSDTQAVENTDRELWRGPDLGNGDYYADSVHVTLGGGIGINVGGRVIVMRPNEWHNVCQEAADLRDKLDMAMLALTQCAADWSSKPGTVMSAAAEVQTEFQRRMQIAADALNN